LWTVTGHFYGRAKFKNDESWKSFMMIDGLLIQFEGQRSLRNVTVRVSLHHPFYLLQNPPPGGRNSALQRKIDPNGQVSLIIQTTEDIVIENLKNNKFWFKLWEAEFLKGPLDRMGSGKKVRVDVAEYLDIHTPPNVVLADVFDIALTNTTMAVWNVFMIPVGGKIYKIHNDYVASAHDAGILQHEEGWHHVYYYLPMPEVLAWQLGKIQRLDEDLIHTAFVNPESSRDAAVDIARRLVSSCSRSATS
jgi:hypothetical protein